MAREKKKYLFNRNHIEIVKIENPEPSSLVPHFPCYEVVSVGNYYAYSHNSNNTEEKLIKKESPLGFYYMSKVRVPKENKFPNKAQSRTIITYPVPGESNAFYQLQYLTEYGDNKVIGREDSIRPWDVYPGDKDFPDSQLKALVEETEKFFSIAEASKTVVFVNGHIYGRNTGITNKTYSLNDIKKWAYESLFGNVKGPRFQTDEEKILAHGFDPKYSFRKDKEKK